MHHTTQTQHFKFDPFDLVILDDLDLTQGHKGLRRVLGSIPETIHVVPSALYQFNTAVLPGEASDPTCDVITDVQIKFCRIFGDLKPGAIKCRFPIENWSRCLADNRGGTKRPPPPSAGRVREYPIGAQVNEGCCFPAKNDL